MKYLYVILSFLLTSCFTTTRTISYDPSYQSTTVVTSEPRPFGWWFRPSYLWRPRPNYYYNPYYYTPTYIPPRNFYVTPRYVPPRPRTNLPLNNQSGPRGGRRK